MNKRRPIIVKVGVVGLAIAASFLLRQNLLNGRPLLGVWAAGPDQLSVDNGQVLGVSEVSLATSTQTEPVDATPEIYQGSYLYGNAADMLKALNVRVYPEDQVIAFPSPELGIGSQIKLYRARPIVIRDGAEERLVRSWSKTVGDLATEQRLNLAEKDIVDPGVDVAISHSETSPLLVLVTRVQESQLVEYSSVDYKITYTDDPTLERGVTKIEQVGHLGKLSYTYLVRRENGVETSRKLLEKKQNVDPVNQIIRRGTKIITYGLGKASWYGGVPALTAAHLSLPKGTMVKVVNIDNGKSVVVRIADRGPFVAGRIIDLSQDAFAQIASLGSGVANVRLEKWSESEL